MATLGNDKITGLSSSEITGDNHAVSKSYSDGLLPSPTGKPGSILEKSEENTSSWSSSTLLPNNIFYAGSDGEMLVAMLREPSTMYATTDLIHWKARTTSYSGTSGGGWGDGGWVNGYWYRTQGDYLGFSTDSITWQTRTSGAASGGFCPGYSSNSIGNCRFFYKDPYYFTSNWSNQLWSSTDTIAWEKRTHNGGTIYSLGCHNGHVLIGGSNGAVTASTDWYHWTRRTTTICGDVYSMSSAEDYVFGHAAQPTSGQNYPYPVDVNVSTDTIHWERKLTGFETCCASYNEHPSSLAYNSNKYYTVFQYAQGSGSCCRPVTISSTDVVVWEIEIDGCDSNTCFCCSNISNRFFSTTDYFAQMYRYDPKFGFFCTSEPVSKRWDSINGSGDSSSLNRRGSITIDSTFCPFYSYQFPKTTQFFSVEIQVEGGGSSWCEGKTTGVNGGNGGGYMYAVFDKIQNNYGRSGIYDEDFNLQIKGSTYAACGMMYNSGIIGSDNLDSFYFNHHRLACRSSGCYCAIVSGFDSNGNEVVLAGAGDVVSSLDGGRTWSLRTRGSNNYMLSALYVDGCRGNFWGGFYGYLCHTTDTIHWECKQTNHRNNCYIEKISYENNAYWIFGCGFLSCSPDGNTWYHRTVNGTCYWRAFSYDSSGGYLLGDCYHHLRASTDSIHWQSRTNAQCCYAGFRYCNSKWYSFGMVRSYNKESCKSITYPVNSSTDTIHWKGECCLPIRGSDFKLSECVGVRHFTLGPNNKTILHMTEPVGEELERYYADCQNFDNAVETLKSTTDFIHWTDHTKQLPDFHLQKFGCQMAVCCTCTQDIHYSSDTKRYYQSGCFSRSHVNSNICSCFCQTNPYYTYVTYQSGGAASCNNILLGDSGTSYSVKCCSACPDYLPKNGTSICSNFSIFKMVAGADFPAVLNTSPGFPGVSCSTRSTVGRKDCCCDIGFSGASSGGSSSLFGPGGGVCSPLGNIPTTDIDTSELKQYEITVSANGSSSYTLAGEDRGGTFGATSNKSLTVKSGDLIAFTLDNTVSGHPFWIKKENSTGDTDRVLAKFVENNGADSGEIILDTYKMKPGTYHYNCQYHSGMHGTITVEEAVVNLDGENGIGSNYGLFGTGGSAAYIYKTGFGIFSTRTTALSGCCDYISRLEYANGLWVNTNSIGMQTSTDSIHWTARTVPFTCGGRCSRIVYGNSTWLTVDGACARTAAASTDAIHWSLRTLGCTNCCSNLAGLAYGNNMFVTKICSDVTASTDTIHWSLRTVGSTLGTCSYQYGLAYGNGTWAVVGSCYNGSLFSSTDTIHWTARTHGLLGWWGYNINYTNGYWFFNGESQMSSSTDIIHWSNRNCMQVNSTSCTPVTCANGYYMYGAVSGCLRYIKTSCFDPSVCQCWSYFDDFVGPYTNDDIYGIAVDNSGQLLVADGQSIAAMSNQRSRFIAGNGGNGCNGGGAGGGSFAYKETVDNGWLDIGLSGDRGQRKIRITWW